MRIAYHLLKKVDATQRAPLLLGAVANGQAVRCSQYLFAALFDEAVKAAKGEGDALLGAGDVDALKNAWRNQVCELAKATTFIDHPALARLLSGWRHWGGEGEARAWWQSSSANDAGLLKLISAFSSETTSHSFGDYAVRSHVRVNPKGIAPYDDIQAVSARVQGLLSAGVVPDLQVAAAKQFVLECQRMQAGKDPDSFDFDED